MCDTSVESCDEGLHFISHQQAVSNLWGRYDPQTKKYGENLLVTVSLFDIESREIPLLTALISGLISSSFADELGAIYKDVITKKP